MALNIILIVMLNSWDFYGLGTNEGESFKILIRIEMEKVFLREIKFELYI